MSQRLRAIALVQLTLNEAASQRLEELIAADHASQVCPAHEGTTLSIDGHCRVCEVEEMTMRQPAWMADDRLAKNAKVLGPQ